MMNFSKTEQEDSTVYLQFANKGDLEAPLLASDNEEDEAVVTTAAKKNTLAVVSGTEEGNPEESSESTSSSNDDDDDEKAVLDARRCSLLNGTWLVGFAAGFALQWLSSQAIQFVEEKGSANDLNLPTAFALVVFSRYWILVYLLPPAVYTYFARRSRNSDNNDDGKNDSAVSKKSKRERRHAFAKVALEAFFECVRFQFGIFCGSLVLLNVVNLLTLATATPIWMLLSYYLVCVFISVCILRVLQLLVDSVCLHVSSVEVVVNYESDSDDEDE